MDEFTDILQFLVSCDLLFQKILNRLNVMIGSALNILDPVCILNAEFFHDAVENVISMLAESRNLCDLLLSGQGLKPAYLHQNPVSDKTKFAENRL